MSVFKFGFSLLSYSLCAITGCLLLCFLFLSVGVTVFFLILLCLLHFGGLVPRLVVPRFPVLCAFVPLLFVSRSRFVVPCRLLLAVVHLLPAHLAVVCCFSSRTWDITAVIVALWSRLVPFFLISVLSLVLLLLSLLSSLCVSRSVLCLLLSYVLVALSLFVCLWRFYCFYAL